MKKNLAKTTLLMSLVALFGLSACTTTNDKSSSVSSTGATSTGTTSSSTDTTSSSKPYVEPVNANGVYNYVASSYTDRTEILGKLEQYAAENNLTGLTLFGNGGYVMYDPRVTKGSETYVPGYGFGILAEGALTADLAKESNAAWKRYYHTTLSDDPKTVNYMNDKGSMVGDLFSYTHTGLWTTAMNSTKDGYDWVNDLANEKPRPLNLSDVGLATKYEVEVKVGAAAKYRTNTTDTALSVFNNREIALDDYLTPYRELYNQSNGMARGAEQLTGAGSIKGMNAYYNATKDGFVQAAWDNVGVKAVVRDGKSYLQFELNVPATPFYAMYYLASNLYSPIPKNFVTEIGGIKNYGTFVEGTKNRTPIDTVLATGPYALEAWEEDMQIVVKKNTNYVRSADKYKIAGIHLKVLTAINSDPEANIKEFLIRNIDATGIPQTKLEDFMYDPRTVKTDSTSNFKLNLNTTTEERWVELFGTEGTITQTKVEDYWDVKPAMSNSDFIKGISYSLNRKEFAEKIGRTPAFDFFSNNYLSDPENGISYNSTKAHKDAIASLKDPSADEFGYLPELAKYYFEKASEALIAQGHHNEGDTIKFELCWMYEADIEDYALIEKYIEDAFNESESKLKLDVDVVAVPVWDDIYYKKMMVGQFDIAFGSISGNTLNPLNFFDVLKSDNSSGFTLNWGPDTSKVSETLVYDDAYWSFDALWTAADQGAYTEDGELVSVYGAELIDEVDNGDGTYTISVGYTAIQIPDEVSVDVIGVVLFGYTLAEKYKEIAVENFTDDKVNKTLTFTVTDENLTDLAYFYGYDVYFEVDILGIVLEQLSSVYTEKF